jgi:hypothetical protein
MRRKEMNGGKADAVRSRAVRRAGLLVLAIAGSAAHWAGGPARPRHQEAPVHQLRVYEIFDANKAAFHDRFRDHAMRIMARHRFNVVATWEARRPGRTEFVYLLEWPDTMTMHTRWRSFLADPEWVEIKRATAAVHGRLVGDIEDRVLQPTSYSPVRPIHLQ